MQPVPEGRLDMRVPASYAAGTLHAFLTNFARNSPAAVSNLELTSLELQRFGQHSKNDRGKLCATFIWPGTAVLL